MAETFKNAQLQGTSSVSTYASLYSTTASTTAVVSMIICNTATTDATYRIAIMTTEGTPAAANWVAYDSIVAANDTVSLNIGMTLGNSQYIRVSSSANTVSFTAFISEIS